MDTTETSPVARALGELLRHPEPLRDIEVERALIRLQAARSDAAYLLLHRVLVLEAALENLRRRTAASEAVSAPAAQSSRSFMRDAAVVTAGVLAGQALWQGLSDGAVGDDVGGLDLEGWL